MIFYKGWFRCKMYKHNNQDFMLSTLIGFSLVLWITTTHLVQIVELDNWKKILFPLFCSLVLIYQ